MPHICLVNKMITIHWPTKPSLDLTRSKVFVWRSLSPFCVTFQIRDEEIGVGGELLTLFQLQHLMSEEYGESHFNAFEQPVLYSQVQCHKQILELRSYATL